MSKSFILELFINSAPIFILLSSFLWATWGAVGLHESVHALAYQYDGCRAVVTERYVTLFPPAIRGSAQCMDASYHANQSKGWNLENEIISYNLQYLANVILICSLVGLTVYVSRNPA